MGWGGGGGGWVGGGGGGWKVGWGGWKVGWGGWVAQESVAGGGWNRKFHLNGELSLNPKP